jgi:formylglycine-generating enzyme required for sulfatase activity
MTDNKNIYQGSSNVDGGRLKAPRAFTGFVVKAFAMLIILSLFNGCYGGKSALSDLERERMEREARAKEEALIKYDDPQVIKKHEKRKRRSLRRERRRLQELADKRELEEELAAEQWWIDKELSALELAEEKRKKDDDEVKLWREKQAKVDKEKKEEFVAIREAAKVRKVAPKTLEQRVLDSLGMVYVKGGCFDVDNGESVKDAGDEADNTKCVDDFYMGRHEITAGDFHEFVEETNYITDAERDGGCYLYTGNTWYKGDDWSKKNDYHWRDISFAQDLDHPVACVSWNDANEFVQWKSDKHGIKYRLPTEAEWEYAASGGNDYREKWSGTNNEGDIGVYAWYFTNSDDRTHPVGQKRSNKLGLFDMSGNVWEWVQDNYDHSEDHKADSGNAPRVIRGGSWYSMDKNVSTDRRFKDLKPNYRDFASGFRLGMDGRVKLNKKANLK